MTVKHLYRSIGVELTEFPDPGDGGNIPVFDSCHVHLVSGGAETRALAIPTFVGQKLQIEMLTDGGDITLTAAGTVNAAGNNTLTFDAALDYIVLEGAKLGGALLWRVILNENVALSTV